MQLEVVGQSFVKEEPAEKRGSRNQHMNAPKSLLRTRMNEKQEQVVKFPFIIASKILRDKLKKLKTIKNVERN